MARFFNVLVALYVGLAVVQSGNIKNILYFTTFFIVKINTPGVEWREIYYPRFHN